MPVNSEGLVNTVKFEESISSEKTALISIMLANNETGTIQPIRELVTIARRKAGNVLFHTDGIQALGKISVNCIELGVDLMAISSHKINGPKGVGGLFVKKGSEINALISGGGQENYLRSGTENVPGIVGFGKACDIPNAAGPPHRDPRSRNSRPSCWKNKVQHTRSPLQWPFRYPLQAS